MEDGNATRATHPNRAECGAYAARGGKTRGGVTETAVSAAGPSPSVASDVTDRGERTGPLQVPDGLWK